MVRCMSFDERIAVDINHVDPIVVGKDWMARLANAMSTVVTHSVTVVSLLSEENEA